jgi:hypothetical protein
MSRYSVIITAGTHTYSFAMDTLGGVFELIAYAGNVTSFEIIEWTNGEATTLHAHTKRVATSI